MQSLNPYTAFPAPHFYFSRSCMNCFSSASNCETNRKLGDAFVSSHTWRWVVLLRIIRFISGWSSMPLCIILSLSLMSEVSGLRKGLLNEAFSSLHLKPCMSVLTHLVFLTIGCSQDTCWFSYCDNFQEFEMSQFFRLVSLPVFLDHEVEDIELRDWYILYHMNYILGSTLNNISHGCFLFLSFFPFAFLLLLW